MTRKITLADAPADDVTAVRPERYYDYVYETYGKAFRSGKPGRPEDIPRAVPPTRDLSLVKVIAAQDVNGKS